MVVKLLHYGFANAIGAGLPLITAPVIIDMIGIEEYGQYALLFLLMNLSVIIIGAGGLSYFNRFFYDKGNEAIASAFYSSFLVALIFSFLCGAYILFSGYEFVFILICPLGFLFFFFKLLLLRMQLKGYSKQYLYAFSIHGVTSSVLLLVFFYIDLNVFYTFFLSFFISLSCAVCYLFLYYIREGGRFVSLGLLVSFFGVFSVSWSLFFDSLFSFFISYVDKYVVGKYLGVEELGRYFLVFQYSMVLVLFFDTLLKYLMPILMKKIHGDISFLWLVKVRFFYSLTVFLLLLASYYSISFVFDQYFNQYDFSLMIDLLLIFLFYQYAVSQVRFDNIVLLGCGFPKTILLLGVFSSLLFLSFVYAGEGDAGVLDIAKYALYSSVAWFFMMILASTYAIKKRGFASE